MTNPASNWRTHSGSPNSDPTDARTVQIPQAPGSDGAPSGNPTMIRRPTSRFLPPAPVQAAEAPVISRDLGTMKRRTGTPELSRNRKIAGDLPSWDPLPPGETLVVRPGTR